VKLPPVIDGPQLPVPRVVAVSERDRRFLIFVAVLLVAIAMGLKSDLLGQAQVWVIGALLVVVAAPAVMTYLAESGTPSIEHVVPIMLGALAVAGLSLMVSQWWQFALAAVVFGTTYYFSGQLDYRQLRDQQRPLHLVLQETCLALALSGSYLVILALQFPLPIRLGGVFLTSFLATYRSFRVFGTPMPVGKALYQSLFVAQLVLFFTWGMSYWVYFTEGVFAVLLFLLWYVNRGLIRHLEEKSFSRNVAIEYGLFAALFLYLFLTSFQPR
jgi:hypothetical protein